MIAAQQSVEIQFHFDPFSRRLTLILISRYGEEYSTTSPVIRVIDNAILRSR